VSRPGGTATDVAPPVVARAGRTGPPPPLPTSIVSKPAIGYAARMMRAAALVTLLCAAPLATQQQPTPEQLLERKLAAPFLQSADWVLDLEQARARAAERGQLVFGYFTTAGP
jgi:hypothetical protein